MNVSASIFVYGTLLPGQPQWALLERYVTDEGWAAEVPGRLLDTARGYPVADLTWPGPSVVVGRCFALLETSAPEALEALDRYEEVDLGLYSRIEVRTRTGARCWAYSIGPRAEEHFMELHPIPSGDWVRHIGGNIDGNI